MALRIRPAEVRRGAAVLVEGSVEPAFPGIRIDRIVEGPVGRQNTLLWTDVHGRFHEEIVLGAAGAYRFVSRALCDGNQPGASATPIAVHVRE